MCFSLAGPGTLVYEGRLANPEMEMDSATSSKKDIQGFWKALYHSLYDDLDRGLTRDALLQGLDQLEDMFRERDHMIVVEMPLHDLTGRRVLEIGPGAGGHSALLARHGAIVTSIDVTPERALSTQAKFDLLGDLAQGCQAINGDAENLPFADGSFDYVYSNGVLHHTHDTERAIAEVLRVLRPEGRAVIMLYCKDSWHYWVNMLLFTGLLRGWLLRGRNWLGHATEWGGKHRQSALNPITRCYSRREIGSLFKGFEGLSLRKHEFYLYLIPFLGRRFRLWAARRWGVHPGGILVYGEPWGKWSPLERWLGPRMGWAWYISARKAAR